MVKKNAKKNSREGDVDSMSMEDLNRIIQEETKSDAKVVAAQRGGSGSVVVNFLVALWVAAMPIYLYTTPMFDLTLEEHNLYFAVVTLVTAVCLTSAYTKTADKERKRLRKKYPAPTNAPTSGKGAKKNRGTRTNSAVALEAGAWSLFYNNVFFLGLFMILAFNVVPEVVPKWINYIVAVAGPGLVVHFLS